MIEINRVVVARYPNGGIGDHFSCLMGAWFYAKRTGRSLVVDWRGSRFNPDPTSTRNCFGHFFEIPSVVGGVPIICGDDVAHLRYQTPIFPDKWTLAKLSGTAHLKHTREEIDAINRLVNSNDDRPEPTVVFNQWIHPSPPKFAAIEFLKELSIATDIRNTGDQIWQENLGESPGIAIHIRHGNGENIGLRAAYWLDPWTLFRQLRLNANIDVHQDGLQGRFADNMPDSLIPTTHFGFSQKCFLKTIAARVNHMKRTRQLIHARPILFCDSPIVAHEMKVVLPDLVVPSKYFLAAGHGPLHGQRHNKNTLVPVNERISFDMMLELELMRRCSALVCMDSNFSILSRILLNDDHIDFLRPTLLNRLVLKIMRD